MATLFFLNPKAFEMGILTVDNINRGKEKYAGKQFGLFFDKTETGKVESLRMLHSIFAFILKFWREGFAFADNCCLFVQLQEMTQTSRVVTVPVG